MQCQGTLVSYGWPSASTLGKHKIELELLGYCFSRKVERIISSACSRPMTDNTLQRAKLSS